MNALKYITCLCCCAVYLLPAQNPSQTWVTGINDFPGVDGYGNLILRFQGDSIQAIPANLRMNFESTMATMTDSVGNLLFYTNGCHIANALGDTMSNGAGLNPGDMSNWTCPTAGYVTPLGAMALPMPGNNHLYYIFHLGARYEPEKRLTFGPFYYSVVDMQQDGGKGSVVTKNNVLADGKLEPFVAVRHGNGRDWWLIIPTYNTNQYHRFLLSKTGVQDIGTQSIGPVLGCQYIGSSAFSPDGTKFARQQNCNLVVLNFDRCTGDFTNPVAVTMPDPAFGGGGVAFSLDATHVFTTTQLSVFSADLSNPNPQMDTIVGWQSIAGNSLHLMQYGPDSKIYLTNMGRGKFLHTITDPANTNGAIGFQARGLALSSYSVRTLPNYPNFRLYDVAGSPCDTLGVNTPVSTDTPEHEYTLSIQPNPAAYTTVLTLPDTHGCIVALYDLSGRKLDEYPISDGVHTLTLDVSAYKPGLYLVQAHFANGSVTTRRLAVIR